MMSEDGHLPQGRTNTSENQAYAHACAYASGVCTCTCVVFVLMLMLLGFIFGIFKHLWSFYFIINILMIPNASYDHSTIGWIFFRNNCM